MDFVPTELLLKILVDDVFSYWDYTVNLPCVCKRFAATVDRLKRGHVLDKRLFRENPVVLYLNPSDEISMNPALRRISGIQVDWSDTDWINVRIGNGPDGQLPPLVPLSQFSPANENAFSPAVDKFWLEIVVTGTSANMRFSGNGVTIADSLRHMSEHYMGFGVRGFKIRWTEANVPEITAGRPVLSITAYDMVR